MKTERIKEKYLHYGLEHLKYIKKQLTKYIKTK